MLALPQFYLESLLIVSPCTVRCHQPEMSWEQAQGLVTLQSATPIALAVAQALGAGSGASAEPAA